MLYWNYSGTDADSLAFGCFNVMVPETDLEKSLCFAIIDQMMTARGIVGQVSVDVHGMWTLSAEADTAENVQEYFLDLFEPDETWEEFPAGIVRVMRIDRILDADGKERLRVATVHPS